MKDTTPLATPAEGSLGIVLSTVTDSSVEAMVKTAQLAEECGFDAVYINEARGDAFAVSLAIASASKQIHIGTNIANVYYRHPYLAAHSVRTIAELSGGRFVVGLGMSHRRMLASLGIDMGNAREHLENYVIQVRAALRGEAGEGFLKTEPAPFIPPVFVAGNTIESAALAGRSGDGLMPFLSPKSYLPTLTSAARQASSEDNAPCILSIPTFLHDDEAAARSAAKYNLAFFALLPNYRRQWRRAGFKSVMDRIQAATKTKSRRELAEEIPDELVEEVCIFGNAAKCRQQIEEFRAAGTEQPVLAVSPVNEDRQTATERAIRSLTH